MTRAARVAPVVLALGLGAAVAGAQAPPASEGEVPIAGEPGGPLPGLTEDEFRLWAMGRAEFDDARPAVEGLGPDFNGDSCRACHQDPVVGGAATLELNVSRFAQDHDGAGPFTDLLGGQILSKFRPAPAEGRESYPAVADVFEQRQPPSLLGLGLMQSIPDAVILANEDPTDADGDGIAGIARLLEISGQIEVGRFGWKSQIPQVLDFVHDAYGNELGATTPDDGRGFAFTADADAVPDPEVTQAEVDAVRFFLEKLAPPERDGGAGTPQVDRGEALFTELRCDRCHIPALAGAEGPVALFSDLLLHDVMGPGFSGMAEDGAPSGLYRTPPLWGIEDTPPYLHDGRAESLQEAILMHAGEAALSSAAYALLPEAQKQALLAFLQDL